MLCLVGDAAQGWRSVREIHRSGLWEMQEMETYPKLAEPERGLCSSRLEKSRFFPHVGSLDIPSVQTLPPHSWL